MKTVEVKITRWGISKLQCIKAVKDLMGLTLQGAKDMVENSKMPCVLRVYDDEKLKVFKDYTQTYCSGMNYTVEDADCDIDTPNDEDPNSDVDVSKYEKMSRTNIVEGFISALNNARAAFNVLINQNDEIGDRYNKVCSEANLLQAEAEKLKANNNNDLCIQLREEIARLKYDNDILREGKKVVETKNDDLTEANKCLEGIVDQLNREKEDLESNIKRLRDTIQKQGKKLAAIREVVIKAIS